MKSLTILRLPAAGLTALIIAACGGGLSPEEARAKAQAHLDQGEVNAAIIELKNALQEAPDAVATRRLLGKAYYEAGDLAGARKELSRAVELGERAPAMVLNLIEVSVRLGRFDEALEAIELLPAERRIEATTDEGFAFLGLDRPDAAQQAFERGLEANVAPARASVGLAILAMERQRMDQTHLHLDRALELEPSHRQALLLKGELLVASRQLDEAVGVLERALKNSKGNDKVAPHIGLARSYLALNAPDKAESHVAALKDIAPDNPQTHYLSGALAYARNDYAAAEKSLLRVLQVDPNHAPTLLLLGSTKFALGQLEQAQEHLQIYVDKVPNNLPARKLLAGVLLSRDQVTQALAVLVDKEALGQEDPQYNSLLGTAHIRLGNTEQATEYFEKAARLSPDNTRIKTQLAVSQLATGAAEKAIAHFENMATADEAGIQPGLLLVVSHLQARQLDAALTAAKGLVEQHGDSPIAQNMLGAVYLVRGENNEARSAFESATKVTPGFVPAVLNLARMDLRQQKPDVARQRLEAALEHQPGHPRLLLRLSELTFAAGDATQGEAYLQQAHANTPEDPQVTLYLTRLRLAQGRVDDAAALLESVPEKHHQHHAWLLEQSRIQLARREFGAAEATLQGLLDGNPGNPALRTHLAQAKLGMNKLDEARGIYESLLEDADDDPGTPLMQLARIGMVQGRTDQALEYVRRLEKAYPDAAEVSRLRGDIMVNAQRYDEAVNAYRTALERAPAGTTLLRLARAVELNGDAATANRLMRDWIAEHPEDQVVGLALAGRQQTTGADEEATKGYMKLLEQNPENPVALNNLAWIHHEAGRTEEALELAVRADAAAPGNAAIMDTLGWLRLSAGQTEQALTLLEQAAAKAPDNAEIHYHYAVALAKGGDHGRARDILERVLKDHEDFESRKKAEEMMLWLR
ncbi:MAG: XrtA/PEP-CTERM system TPR-repeat protein PrsT [Gammaproteobacteria bacterium]|nr:XrtA/PEP-CTERM system TPR-repeat protein PrsT [Gammaproteobacteria bacterium]